MFQSTPARGGRRRNPDVAAGRQFQSTPARGGRRIIMGLMRPDWLGFNPRPHAAGDNSESSISPFEYVSIHARTRRATSSSAIRSNQRIEFQSTPARGGRPRVEPRLSILPMFQSTPARGGRQVSATQQPVASSFNPRPHAAGDVIGPAGLAARLQFQSTPARGGRRSAPPMASTYCPFQSTPARGGRP